MAERAIELARRQTGAVEIALFWKTSINRLFVCVEDTSDGAGFQLVVGAGEAMEVFHHPYAYAASRGVEYWLHNEEMEVIDL